MRPTPEDGRPAPRESGGAATLGATPASRANSVTDSDDVVVRRTTEGIVFQGISDA